MMWFSLLLSGFPVFSWDFAQAISYLALFSTTACAIYTTLWKVGHTKLKVKFLLRSSLYLFFITSHERNLLSFMKSFTHFYTVSSYTTVKLSKYTSYAWPSPKQQPFKVKRQKRNCTTCCTQWFTYTSR